MSKLLLLSIVLILGFSSTASAQTPQPTPQRPDDEVVRISTNLIQVDITVTDKKGNIVRDIRPDEIEIYENGKRQKLSNFSFVSNVREESRGEEKAAKRPVSPLPPPPVRPEQVRRTIALVVDDLSLSFESVHFVRRALRKFVDEQMQDGDLVAIIRTGGGIGALQQFTTDRRQLHAAIEKVRWNMAGAGKIGAFEPLRPLGVMADEDTPEGGRSRAEMERDLNDFRSDVFATGTMGAVNYVIRGMQELPGRKSILLMSDGFKLFTEGRDGFKDAARVMEPLRRLIDQAHRASVVIYTLDPRGLQTLGLTAADNTAERTAEMIESEMATRRLEMQDTQDGLVYLARQTGGYAVINNNDISGGIRRILDDQSYYLAGYAPDDETFDPKTRRFNRLEIKVTRPGTNVRYRSGFFGFSDEARPQPTAETGSQRLLSALVSPFAVNDISLQLNALFVRNQAKLPLIRSLLHVNARDLAFSDGADNKKVLKFDVLSVAFGENGIVADHLAQTYTVTLNSDEFRRMQQRGFVYDFVFPIKKPGAYQLRVALRDHGSEKVGSASQFIEVPDLKKNRLTLSGAALENISFEEWQRRNTTSAGVGSGGSSPLIDTSLRQFKSGTVLNYGFVIFNSKTGPTQQPNLVSKTRLFKDGKPIFEGLPQPVLYAGQTDPKAVNFMSTLSLGTVLGPGDYLLEIAITDKLQKGERATARNYVQFEIVP
ncbi:hypothetical protein BH20ACI2_BH20ACI2_21810 [soil metagenome]